MAEHRVPYIQPNGKLDPRVIPPGASASVNREALVRGLGYALHFGDRPPSESTEFGQPVYWVREAEVRLIPVTPTPPSFDPVRGTVTLPNLVGVTYKVDGTPRTGTYSVPGTGPTLVRVTAEAQQGYQIIGVAEWTSTVRPTISPGTVLATETFNGAAGELIPRSTPVQSGRRAGPAFSDAGAISPSWFAWGNSAGFNRDGQGHAVVAADAAGVTAIAFDPGVADVDIEVDIAQIPTQGKSLTFEVRFGADPNDASPFQAKGFQAKLVWDPHTNVAVQPDAKLFYTNRNHTSGKWVFSRRGGTVTVKTPGRPTNSDTASWDKAAESGNWGTGVVISVPQIAGGGDPGLRIDQITVKAA